MTTQIFPQTVIAVIWDFDETLIRGSMQSPIFENYSVNEEAFWREVNQLSKFYAGRDTRVNQSTAYLNHILTYTNRGIFHDLNNDKLEKLGANIEFYEGVISFFDYLKQKVLADGEFHKYDISVELYIVSTGLSRMIKGSKVYPLVDGVWGCEFIEDVAQPGYLAGDQPQLMKNEARISQVGYIIDDTTKTRAIFEINKGVNKYPEIDVNSQIPFEQRRIPFVNMVYIADGPSDIPVYSLIKHFGGRTYAVYQPGSERHFDRVYRLQRQNRVESFGPADYQKGTQTFMWIERTIGDIALRIVRDKQHALSSAVQQPLGHIESANQNGVPNSTAQVELPGIDESQG